jgi:hypothetical protein
MPVPPHPQRSRVAGIVISDKIRRTCDLFSRAIAAGEDRSDVVGQLAAADGVERPAIWRRLRTGGVLPPYKTARTKEYSASYADKNRREIASAKLRAQLKASLEATPRASRDPCPRCGTRGDVGCSHHRAELGTGFSL